MKREHVLEGWLTRIDWGVGVEGEDRLGEVREKREWIWGIGKKGSNCGREME